MTKRVLIPSLIVLAALFSNGIASAGIFADVLGYFSPGGADLQSGQVDTFSCIGAVFPADPTFALGPPDSRFISLGEQGSISLGFSGGRMIFDGPGDDFIVYGSCNAPNEPGRVFASPGGASWVSLGNVTSGTARYFDLASVGMSEAEFIRIDDLPGGYGLPIGQAFDVDALEGLHVEGFVPTNRSTWGQLKATYR